MSDLSTSAPVLQDVEMLEKSLSNSFNDDTGKHEQSKAVDAAEPTADGQENYLPMGPRLYMITASLMLGVFCVALDNNIIAVAIPRITDEFHALNDVGWYGSAYLLPGCGFQLLFGKLYSLFSVKWVYLFGLLLFEVGTVICGAAPNSIALIVGRAIAGIGSAGLFTGAMLTIAHTVPLAKRPAFMGIVGGTYGIASVVGPLIGGAFTNRVTWRWCFFINLPFGGITMIGILFFLKLEEKPAAFQQPWFTVLKRLDPIGSILFVPAIICLLLALQWGGVTYAWSSGPVIALLVVFAVALIGFIVLQVFIGDDATLPARIISQRSIAFASLFSFCLGASFFIVTYYMPIWFQAIKGVQPVTSGIDFLPFILPEITGVMLSGGLVSAFGYANPFFIASSIIMSIGAGLCTLFTVHASQGAWIGYQFIWGIGIGIGFQQGTVVAQTVLPLKDIAVGTAAVLFVNLFGGAIFVAVAQNIFASNLIHKLLALNIQGLDPHAILYAGATNLRDVVGPEHIEKVLVQYNDAIVKVFQLGLIMSCLSIVGALGVEWKSIKKET
ncbi:hypothetical protein OCU04_000180 [Sclerotinia nivalis]|uniref:Major facilitator superfamily (MFS) profile domain-containing protein n=1 Tax=Sclerotinia nivalis TaxID=352851 RepID=A0A9X0AVJ9_9HELO|nr:hypothetical protein OCU04_000180 [Sclerotinia nivalis]